ncbi:MAG: alanine/glycine:cation symporter family protein [Rikenellaceae bacterium]
MGELIGNIIIKANDFIWSYVMIASLIAVGLIFTFKSKFVQFRYIPEMFRLLKEKSFTSNKSTSSFGAFCVSLASRVGTGNMAGVATAIAIGGPGAIFWMWLVALIGAASSFAESSLAQLYKRSDGANGYVGGPAYYMEQGLNKRWMGVLFAVIISFTFGLFFNSVQSNTIVLSLGSELEHYKAWFGIGLSITTLLVIFGGIKRIVSFSSVVVPIMTVGYLGIALFVMVTNIHLLWDVIKLIVGSAFGIEQAFGGGIGVAIIQGVRRGLFSNEAGMGSAPNAAATADVTHPVKQGLIQSLGVFADTMIVCSCTAFLILVSGVPIDGSIQGIELTQAAMNVHLGDNIGAPFITVCIFLFAFSSIIGNYYYGEANIKFITNKKAWLTIYRIMVGVMVFWGSVASLEMVWNLADFSMAIMALINLIAIFMLRKAVVMLYVDYNTKRKKGVISPQFKNDEFESWK